MVAENHVRRKAIEDLARAILEARLERGLTQEQLAIEAGVAKSTVYNLEKATHPRPQLLKVYAVCRVLGLDPSPLLERAS